MTDIKLQPASLDRMVRAVEKVRQRLLRSTAALESARVPYAVIGDNAVAAEKVKPEYTSATPDVSDSIRGLEFQMVELASLVEMKLNSWRRKDQVHLIDMIEIGLIDQTWPGRFPKALGVRLQELLDDPDG